jgi:hypothetical protein
LRRSARDTVLSFGLSEHKNPALVFHFADPFQSKKEFRMSLRAICAVLSALVICVGFGAVLFAGQPACEKCPKEEMQVAVEVRLVSLSDACAKRCMEETCPKGVKCAACNCPCPDPKACSTVWNKVHFLSKKQFSKLFAFVQEDMQTNVMQAPKLTVFNGQSSHIHITDDQYYVTGLVPAQAGEQTFLVPENRPYTTGFKMTARPTVTADRRYVKMNFSASLTELISVPVPLVPITTVVRPLQEDGTPGDPVTFTQHLQQPKFATLTGEESFTVPDGGTAMFTGWRSVRPVKEMVATPILSKIPYVGEMFQTEIVRPEDVQIFVLVTPRIIVAQEEEQRVVAPPPCKEKPIEGLAQVSATEPLKLGTIAPAPRAATSSCPCQLTNLLSKYQDACSRGESAEALKLAVEALSHDPMCFSKKATGKRE